MGLSSCFTMKLESLTIHSFLFGETKTVGTNLDLCCHHWLGFMMVKQIESVQGYNEKATYVSIVYIYISCLDATILYYVYVYQMCICVYKYIYIYVCIYIYIYIVTKKKSKEISRQQIIYVHVHMTSCLYKYLVNEN